MHQASGTTGNVATSAMPETNNAATIETVVRCSLPKEVICGLPVVHWTFQWTQKALQLPCQPDKTLVLKVLVRLR